MEPAAYFDSIDDRLLSDPLIASVDFVDRWQTEVNGYFRARFTFANGQLMEFSEYVQRSGGGIEIITYAYQWMTADNNLICRWDNTPHFPRLSRFPCHRHDGNDGNASPDEARTIAAVLNEIARRNSD